MKAKQNVGRVTRTLAAALAVAAVAAPAALANHQDVGPRLALELRHHVDAIGTRPDDRATGLRPTTRLQDDSDALTRYLRNHLSGSTAPVRPDDRAGIRGPQAPAPMATAQSASDGFDWSDAGIGAGFGSALLALLGGMLVLMRHARSRTASV